MWESNYKTLIIANPQSANGTLGQRWTHLQEIIRLSFGPFEHRFTERPGDGTSLTRQGLEEGFEMIVAMGGDGTISEVVNGFFTVDGPIAPSVVLGVLPFGTGGDFRKTIEAPKSLPRGAYRLTGQRTKLIDVGRLTYTTHLGQQATLHFINIASFGISGVVDELVNSTTKVFGGRVSFAIATVRAMMRYTPQKVLLTLDGGNPEAVMLQTIAVANGKYFGGGMTIAPEAVLDDGLFDVVTLQPMSALDTVLHGHMIYKGTHLRLPHVRFTRAKKVEAIPFVAEERILLDVDGETPGVLPATFEILPQALRLKIPQS